MSHFETAPNGVDHLIAFNGRCATCGRAHDWLRTDYHNWTIDRDGYPTALIERMAQGRTRCGIRDACAGRALAEYRMSYGDGSCADYACGRCLDYLRALEDRMIWSAGS